MDIDIIICTERGPLEQKSALLIHSIRHFSGALSDCPVYSYAPRPGCRPSASFYAFCENHGVTCIDEPLNTEDTAYPLANKPIVCAHHEARSSAEYLLFLDSDSMFVNPVSFPFFGGEPFDVAINPVDSENIGVGTGLEGEERAYWQSVYHLLGIEKRRPVVTTVSKAEILEYYNSGFVLAKREVGLFRNWLDNFRAVRRVGIVPARGEFFVEQSVLAATISQRRLRVKPLGSRLNYPLVHHHKRRRWFRPLSLSGVGHVHYHKLFEGEDRGRNWREVFGWLRKGKVAGAVQKYLIEDKRMV